MSYSSVKTGSNGHGSYIAVVLAVSILVFTISGFAANIGSSSGDAGQGTTLTAGYSMSKVTYGGGWLVGGANNTNTNVNRFAFVLKKASDGVGVSTVTDGNTAVWAQLVTASGNGNWVLCSVTGAQTPGNTECWATGSQQKPLAEVTGVNVVARDKTEEEVSGQSVVPQSPLPAWPAIPTGLEITASLAQLGGTSVDTVSAFGSLGTVGGKWQGGVLAPNGSIYGIPRVSASVLKIDPTTDTITTFGNLGAGEKWMSGVLAPNGFIYGIPFNATSVLKIDPVNDTVTTFGSLPGTQKWIGAVLAPNGSIYGIPRDSATVLKIDTTNDTISTFGSLGTGSDKWQGGVLGTNGNIYGIPVNSTTVLKIDTSNDTATTFGSLTGTGKWIGGALAPNGAIYGVPLNATTVLKINTTNDTATTFGSLGAGGKWIGAALGPDGSVYGIPANAAGVLKINTTNDTATTFGSTSGSWKWSGGVLAPNGAIYGIPAGAPTVLKIDTGLTPNPNLILSPYLNKF